MVLSDALYLGRRAIEQLEYILPYLYKKTNSVAGSADLWRKSRGVRTQRELVDGLQEGDDWLLIVLDACRYDMFSDQYQEYLSGTVQPSVTAGKNTFEYGRLIWGDDEYDVTYVSAATPIHSEPMDFSCQGVTTSGLKRQGDELREYYQGFVPAEHISTIIDVWKTAWDEELGVAPPEAVTDTAIQEAQSTDTLVTHYFQPHAPYIGEERELGAGDKEGIEDGQKVVIDASIHSKVTNGEITDAQLKTLYQSNLDRVLMEVSRLVSSVDFERVVVMGDHGEALGEYNQYFHQDEQNPYVRLVPWCEVEDVNEDALPRREEFNIDSENTGGSVEQRLQDLGYIE
jgi:hypothetical protein